MIKIFFRKYFAVIAAFLFIAFLFIGAICYSIVQVEEKPVIETPVSENAVVPAEIQKMLEKPTSAPVNKYAIIPFAEANMPASTPASFRIPILMYHYVEYVQNKKDRLRTLLNLNPDVFEAQVSTLKDSGYTFMTARELEQVLDGNFPLPPHPILLTFDDGHWDFATVVLPILKKYQVRATAYIIPGFVGGSDFMTKDQVQEAINSGLVEIGAHTVHHIALKGKLLPIVQYEVGQSKAMLESTYHIHVVSFAYPGGAFDMQAADVVKDDGFATAVSTVPGIEQSRTNRYFLYRLRPGLRTGAELLNWLNQNVFQPY